MTGLTRKSILTTAGLTALSVLAGCTGAERPRETSGAPEATATPEPASSPSAGPGVLLVFFSRAGENPTDWDNPPSPTATVAEGWVDNAIGFWERQIGED